MQNIQLRYLISFLLVGLCFIGGFSQGKQKMFYDIKGQRCTNLNEAIKYGYEIYDSVTNHTQKEIYNAVDDRLLYKGSYINNTTRDGLFISYADNGNVSDSGYYKNGKITGVWHYYYKNKQLANIVQFNDTLFKYIKCIDTLGNEINCYTSTGERMEIMPAYVGGTAALMKFLQDNIRYPLKSRKDRLEGRVIVKFFVDTDGRVREPTILKDGVGGDECAQEALRVIAIMPNWIPGVQRNKMVKVYYTLPVTFSLPSK